MRAMVDSRQKAVIFTMAAAALWGTSFPVIKYILEFTAPAPFLLLRFSVATLLMLLIFVGRGGRWSAFASPYNVMMGLFLSLSFYLQYLGQVNTSAGEAAVLLNTSPVIVPVLGFLLIGERLSRFRYLSSGIGLAGVVLISGIVGERGIDYSTGAAILLMAAFFTSMYIVMTKKISVDAGPVEILTPVFFYSTLFFIPYSLTAGNIQTGISSTALYAALYLAVGCTVLPFLLWYRGLERLTATASTVIALLEPVVSIMIAAFFLSEYMTYIQYAGTALIFISITIISLNPAAARQAGV